MITSIWPLFDLAVVTPTLTLRYIDDALAVDLAELAARGIHDPASTPFLFPFTDVEPPEQQRNTLRHYWELKSTTRPDAWNLPFAVIVDGEAVGTSSIGGRDFAVMRSFETGSWLGLEHQGQGYGKELRRATLTLGFRGFGADYALTGAWHDNAPSLAVTRSLGYREEGARLVRRRDQRDEMLGFRMDRPAFDALHTADIELVGVDAAREFLEIT